VRIHHLTRYDVAAFSIVGRPHIVETHEAGRPDLDVDWQVTSVDERPCPLHGKHVRVHYDSPAGCGSHEFSNRKDRVTIHDPSRAGAAA
jgi:hypothetical protein